MACLSFFFLGLTICGSWILKAVLKNKTILHFNTNQVKMKSRCRFTSKVLFEDLFEETTVNRDSLARGADGAEVAEYWRRQERVSPLKHSSSQKYENSCFSRTHSTDTLSRRNRSRWGYGGRNMPPCSPHGRAEEASAATAAQSRAGTPTAQRRGSSSAQSSTETRERRGGAWCTLTRRYCARATFWGILRYSPPVISQACKTNMQAWNSDRELCSVIYILRNPVPAGGAQSLCPAHRHRSGCSAQKEKAGFCF